MKKILVIEDDPEVLDNLAELLELKSYEVLRAKNGAEGIDTALTNKPDLIISDIMMPEVNGYQVLKKLRSYPETFPIPFLFLTAKAEKLDRRYGINLGADDYLTKPFENHEILSAIDAMLDKYSMLKSHYQNQLNNFRENIATTLPHEFSTPLNSILGFSQILKSNFSRLSKYDIETMLENIYDSGSRLHRLIQNYNFYVSLLDYTDNFAPPTKSDGKELFLSDQVYDVAQRYDRIKDLQDNLDCLDIKVNGDHLLKVTEELTDNAFKFSPPNSQIIVSNCIRNKSAIFSFANTGRGMTEEQINKIGAFTQFERKQYEQQGLGLGLTIVKKIVSLYNGSFKIESIPNEMTTVEVHFPII